MADHVFKLECAALGDATLVGFRGREGLSRCFAYDVFVTLVDVTPLDTLLGEKAVLWVEREPRYGIAGIVGETEVIHEMPDRSLCRLRIVPRLFALSLSRHSRMFTDKKVPEIIEAVLKDAGISDYELRLGAYPKEEHVCQYQESDLAFISRWMEHEGIFYFFEHEDGADKLVISDDSLQHATLRSEAVRYFPVAEAAQGGGFAFRRFSAQHRARAAKVALGDYDYAKPTLEVAGEGDALAGGFGTQQTFGDDRFFDPGRGGALAKRRAEELLALQTLHRAAGNVHHLRSGYGFEVSEHPVAALNKKYLCVTLEMVANLGATTGDLARLTGLPQSDTFSVELEAIDARTPFRPARATAKPRVFGYVTGVIDGAADSDYAQLDDQGRYKIALHFDESGLDGGTASTQVRMVQPHAGNPEGMHFPLRKGTEVMVAFLDGDPDRPLIAGAVPNAQTPSPVTESNHTHNIVHTGGDNVFDFEDVDGGQWITFSTPTENTYLHLGKPFEDRTHHIVLHTDGNNLFDYGSNQDITVGSKLDETVQKAVKETYKANQTSTVFGNQTTHVTGATEETYGSTQTTITMGQVTETYQVPHQSTVSAAPRDEVFLASQSTNVSGGGLTAQLNGDHTRIVVGSTSNTLGGTYSREATGAVTEVYLGPVTRMWGPTTGTIDTLDMVIPGGVTHLILNHEVKVPGDQWFELVETDQINFKLQVAQLLMKSNLFRAKAQGVSLTGISFKGDATNIGVTVNGFTSKTKAMDDVGKVQEMEIAAFIIKI